jgi:RNA polymerase sigma factor (sigma-70 family)
MAREEFDFGPCLQKVREQDQQAARLLVEELYPLVIRIVRCHLPRRMAEEDLAQEIFVKVFSQLERYEVRRGVPFPHWVSRVAVRTCLDALRAERRRPEVRWSDMSEEQAAWLEFMLAEEPGTPDLPAAAAREIVETLLSELSASDRLVITLLDLEQQSVRQIAQLTGWSVTGVKVRAFRARRKLRAKAAALSEREGYERI